MSAPFDKVIVICEICGGKYNSDEYVVCPYCTLGGT